MNPLPNGDAVNSRETSDVGNACIDVSLAAVLYRAICSDFAAQQIDWTAF